LKFVHIINPVTVPETSDLFLAQPITFESFKRAKEMASKVIDVVQITAQYAEDHAIIPDYLIKTEDLIQSVLNIADFKIQRKLPLLRDLMDKAIEYSNDQDFIIFSNVDIGLMPHFYQTVVTLIDQRYDGIAINRKTINEFRKGVEYLPLIYGERGEIHEGIDTFVMKRSALKNFTFENSIIGTGPVGLIFCINMIREAKKFIWLQSNDLTFHLGNDKKWTSPELLDYIDFSYGELKKICKTLSSRFNGLFHRQYHQLIEETVGLCDEIISNTSVSNKFHSQYRPKRLIAEFSKPVYYH